MCILHCKTTKNCAPRQDSFTLNNGKEKNAKERVGNFGEANNIANVTLSFRVCWKATPPLNK